MDDLIKEMKMEILVKIEFFTYSFTFDLPIFRIVNTDPSVVYIYSNDQFS